MARHTKKERDSASLLAPPGNLRPENSGSNFFVFRCCLAASIILILLGLETGVLSETITTIKKDQKTPEEEVQLMAVILHVIGLFGSMMTGLFSNRFGRRPTILFVGILFFIAPFIMGFTNHFFVTLGRMVAHVGAGSTLSIVPIYVVEISPAISRGWFACLPDVFVSVGNIIGCVCNFIISKLKYNGWRVMMCAGTISMVLITLAVRTMPESPRWLVMRGRLGDAKRILSETYSSEQEAKRQVDDIKEAAGIPRNCNEAVVVVQSTERSLWEDLLGSPSEPVYHMMILACLIHFLRQACGIDVILLHMPEIFDVAGVNSSTEKFWLTVGVEAVKTACTVLAAFLLDKHRLGRRRLLLISLAGMIFCLVPLGTCVKNLDQINNEDTWVAHVCIASLFGYVASYAIGLGPVTSVYVSELFPLQLRAQGCAIAFAVNQWMGILMASASLVLHNSISFAGAIYFFAAVACVAWVVFYKIIEMPETQGLKLEAISNIFGQVYQGRSLATREVQSRSSAAREKVGMTRR